MFVAEKIGSTIAATLGRLRRTRGASPAGEDEGHGDDGAAAAASESGVSSVNSASAATSPAPQAEEHGAATGNRRQVSSASLVAHYVCARALHLAEGVTSSLSGAAAVAVAAAAAAATHGPPLTVSFNDSHHRNLPEAVDNAATFAAWRQHRAVSALAHLSGLGAPGRCCETVAAFLLGSVAKATAASGCAGGAADSIFCATADTILQVAVTSCGCCIVSSTPTCVAGDCVALCLTDANRKLMACGAVEAAIFDLAGCGGEQRAAAAPESSSRIWSSPQAPRTSTSAAAADGGDGPVLVLGGAHASTILCAAASPDGYVATGGCDGAVVVWTVEHATPLATLSAHSDWVRFVFFARVAEKRVGGVELITAADDSAVIHWDAREGRPLARAQMDEGRRIHAAARRWDGRFFVYGNEERVVLLGDELRFVAAFAPHYGSVTALALTIDDELLVSGGEDECVVVSRLLPTPTPLARCDSFVTQRRCMSFMTCVTAIVVLASPPTSSVVVVAVCASDGSFVEWVVDPAEGVTKALRKSEWARGALLTACAAQPTVLSLH